MVMENFEIYGDVVVLTHNVEINKCNVWMWFLIQHKNKIFWVAIYDVQEINMCKKFNNWPNILQWMHISVRNSRKTLFNSLENI